LVDSASGLRVVRQDEATSVGEPRAPVTPFEDHWQTEFWYKWWFDCTPHEVRLPQAADPEGKLKTVHVVYSADLAELPGVLLSMTSLSRNLHTPEDVQIHLIVSKADLAAAKRTVRCFSRSTSQTRVLPSVTIHELMPAHLNMDRMRKWQNFRRELIMENTFARFYLHKYLPQAPRALWLDADTIVRADVAELYRMSMNKTAVLAMLPEAGQWKGGRLDKAMQKGNYPNATEYNSGVVVFDLEKWRSDNYTEESEYWTRYFSALGGDQVGLNVALVGKIQEIPDWRWNARGFQAGRPPWRCMEGAKIVHWSGESSKVKKTWMVGEDPAERYRFRYDLVEPYVLYPACNMSADAAD